MDKNRKRAIVNDIASHFGGAAALSESEASVYLGISRNVARTFLAQIDHFRAGSKKMYLAIDIAEVILRETIPTSAPAQRTCPYTGGTAERQTVSA